MEGFVADVTASIVRPRGIWIAYLKPEAHAVHTRSKVPSTRDWSISDTSTRVVRLTHLKRIPAEPFQPRVLAGPAQPEMKDGIPIFTRLEPHRGL